MGKSKKTSYFFLLSIFFVISLTSCEDELLSENVIYSNDFKALDLRNFVNGRLIVFQGDTIMGFYNNEEVTVRLLDLPPHNALRITIDVLAHDSWDGNLDDGVSGPDFWFFKIDDQEVYRTTFSNTPCVSSFCLRQSYPNEYFRQNKPKSGAIQTNIPGICSARNRSNGTSKYQITKIVSHKGSEAKLSMADELKQTNSPNPKCDESWSVSKIQVSAMVVK